MSAGPDADRPYPDVPAAPQLPQIEEEILARWEAEGTFRASVEQRPADDEFVFYDGPPFANGLPHYGHLLTGYVKDAVPRYQTMRGQRVERRFGWDCHGLPAETEAEKELGVAGRGPITEYGIDRFNEYCRTSVLRYTRRVGALRHPPGPLGRLRATTTRRWTSPTWRASCGPSSSCGTRASSTRATASCPTAGSARPRCPTSRPARTTPTATAQDPAVTVAFELGARATGRPGRWRTRASGCGRRRRGRCRPTWPSPSAPTSTTPSSSGTGPASSPARAPSAPTRSSSRGPARVGVVTGAELVGRTYRPLFHYFAEPAERLPRAGRRLRGHRRGHRRRAHGTRVRRGRPAPVRSGRHRRGLPGRRPGPLHRRGARLRGPAGVRRQPAGDPRPQDPGPARRARTPTSTATRTAGAPTRRSSTRRSARGSCR